MADSGLMFRTPVTSSALTSVGYDPALCQLEIEFTSGWVYTYFNIPLSLYTGLMNALSKGKFFCRFIRGSGYWERVE